MRALREHGTATHDFGGAFPDLGELLYENDFPDWFVTHSKSQYGFDWKEILPAVRNTQFFFPQNTYFSGPGANITGQRYLGEDEAAVLGELWCAKIRSGSHLKEMLALICTASLR